MRSGALSGSFSAVTVAPLWICGTGQPASINIAIVSPPRRTIILRSPPPLHGPDSLVVPLGRVGEGRLVDGRELVDEHRLAHGLALVLAQLGQRLGERRLVG